MQSSHEEEVLPKWIRAAQMKRSARLAAAPVYPVPQVSMIEKAYNKKKPEKQEEPPKKKLLPFRTGLLARMAAKGGVWQPPSMRKSWIEELMSPMFG